MDFRKRDILFFVFGSGFSFIVLNLCGPSFWETRFDPSDPFSEKQKKSLSSNSSSVERSAKSNNKLNYSVKYKDDVVSYDESGGVYVPKSRFKLLWFFAFDQNLDIKKDELKNFNLTDNQINSVSELVEGIKADLLRMEGTNFSLVSENENEAIVRIPADALGPDGGRDGFGAKLTNICGPIADAILPSLETGISRLTGNFGEYERFIRVKIDESGQAFYEIIDLDPSTLPSDDTAIDFDQMRRFAISEYRLASDEVPDRFSHIFQK